MISTVISLGVLLFRFDLRWLTAQVNRLEPSIQYGLETEPKLRQEYHEWKSTDSAARFTRIDEGRTVVNIDNVIDWDKLKKRDLVQLHSRLAEQIKSEILGKHHSRLKWPGYA